MLVDLGQVIYLRVESDEQRIGFPPEADRVGSASPSTRLDLAVYRRVRSLARAPERVRWVRRYSRLGEHGAVWLVLGGSARRAMPSGAGAGSGRRRASGSPI